jgi:hypothetical protein
MLLLTLTGCSTTTPEHEALNPAKDSAQQAPAGNGLKQTLSANVNADAEIMMLIKQLNDKKLAARTTATKALVAMGKDAIPSLKRALTDKTLDTETRVSLRDIVKAYSMVEAAKTAKEVTDPATGMRVVIHDDGSIKAYKNDHIYWSMKLATTPEAVVLENGLIILKPSGIAIDPATGTMVSKPGKR